MLREASIRFWSKVDRGEHDECWPWTACDDGRGGYGVFWLRGRNVLAHRVAYMDANGPIPDGLQIDHLCRNRRCCNPNHLEPVTIRTNVLRGIGVTAENARKTHCIHGHEFTPENTVHRPAGGRSCRACDNAKARRYRTRKANKKRETV